MKRALLFLFVASFFQLAQAQTLTLQPIPATAEADIDDPSTIPNDVVAHATLTNTSNETKTFTWTRNVVSIQEGWKSGVCDVNFCYPSGQNTAEFELAAGQSGIMDVHAYPSGFPTVIEGAVPGEAVIKIRIEEVGNADNFIEGEYQFEVQGTVNSIEKIDLNNLQVFPNPATTHFELKGVRGLQSVSVYNLLGKELLNYDFAEGVNYDVSNLQNGLYLVTLRGENNDVLKTVRLHKR